MAPPIAIAPLPLDTVVTGALRAGPTERFTVRDAGVVTVDSLVGDADLYLFGDADLAALTCASTTASLTVGVRGDDVGDGPGGGGSPGPPLLPALAAGLAVRSVRERRVTARESRCAARRTGDRRVRRR